jgi:DNA repair protein RadC
VSSSARTAHAARDDEAKRFVTDEGPQRSANRRCHAGAALASETVEVFAVACLSTRHRLLAWHVLSRGTRSSTPISLPDVFVPACLTPGTTALLVVHNHPSGDPTPSPDDARLTLRLAQAADILDMPLLDHLIVGDTGRYFSFREAGALNAQIADGVRA